MLVMMCGCSGGGCDGRGGVPSGACPSHEQDGVRPARVGQCEWHCPPDTAQARTIPKQHPVGYIS